MTKRTTDQGQLITVTPAVYDALREAGLLVSTPATEARPWPTWGQEVDNDMVECRLILGERFGQFRTVTRKVAA
jgi:hypothetical protein